MITWREPRVKKALRVKVRGVDGNGNSFVQDARTVDISRKGARLTWISCVRRVGEIIEVKHGWRKARFRVAWIGQLGSLQDHEIGICCMEPGRSIWGVKLPAARPTSYHEPAPAQPPRNPLLSLSSPASSQQQSGLKRKHQRYRCIGSAEMRLEGSDSQLHGTVTDVSISGCYVEMSWPPPEGTFLKLVLTGANLHVQARGRVKSSHPSMGAGIQFVQIGSEERGKLQQFIDQLAGAVSAHERADKSKEPPPEKPIRLATGARRSIRVDMAVPVSIRWFTPEGIALEKEVTTRVVNGHGCMVPIEAAMAEGTTLELVQRTNHQVRKGRVVWCGGGPRGEHQVAIELERPDPQFWGPQYLEAARMQAVSDVWVG